MKNEDFITYGALAVVAYLVYKMVNNSSSAATSTTPQLTSSSGGSNASVTVGPLGPTNWSNTLPINFGVNDPNTWDDCTDCG